MELHDYLQIARRRGWIIIITALIATLSAFAFSRVQTPIYKASMELFIQPARADFGLSESSRKLISSYIGILYNQKSADEIRQRLNLDYDRAYIYGSTKIAEDGARYAVQIEVRDYDGDTANRIAREWAQLFVDFRNRENNKQRREDRVDAVLGDDPKYVKDSPRTATNTAAGGILGALVGLLIVIALETAQASVLRSNADIERKLTLPLMGSIPSH
ncbi:MAG: Wzz/FepE/Etk N-terminal domain-containing protein [Anaerolineae bacterium]|nr:Wzz/FepE/Etk N-terminal domain-containing protein [Anaerolineae bacterium]